MLLPIFELILLDRIEGYLGTTDNECGFKKDMSTNKCVYELKEFVEFYKSDKTSVFSMFLDASKTFDQFKYLDPFQEAVSKRG